MPTSPLIFDSDLMLLFWDCIIKAPVPFRDIDEQGGNSG